MSLSAQKKTGADEEAVARMTPWDVGLAGGCAVVLAVGAVGRPLASLVAKAAEMSAKNCMMFAREVKVRAECELSAARGSWRRASTFTIEISHPHAHTLVASLVHEGISLCIIR